MRWYVNDVSLQGQFAGGSAFEVALRELISVRARIESLRLNLRTTRTLPDRNVGPSLNLRTAVQQSRDRDLRSAVLIWLDRTGPFVEDDQLPETDNYFEHLGHDVTDSGLGEAARRVKAGERVATFSFSGGAKEFETSPLSVDQGLPEERLGKYDVENFWTVQDLEASALSAGPLITSWKLLVESARERFSWLVIPDSVYQNSKLAREPFEVAIRDRALVLFGYLNAYMAGRSPDGVEGPNARSIVQKYFVGDRALFTGESQSNQRDFRNELSFPDPEDSNHLIFAHWHGKISHRFFRLHFEWPVPVRTIGLKVVYLGPKLTRS